MSIQDELYQLIIKRYLMGRIPDGFDKSSNLIDSGILDSFMLVGLVSHIEKQYGVKFGSGDIVTENFNSLPALEAIIQQKLQQKENPDEA